MGLTGIAVLAIVAQEWVSSSRSIARLSRTHPTSFADKIAAMIEFPAIYRIAHCDDWYSSSEVVPCRISAGDSSRGTAVIFGDSIGLQWYAALVGSSWSHRARHGRRSPNHRGMSDSRQIDFRSSNQSNLFGMRYLAIGRDRLHRAFEAENRGSRFVRAIRFFVRRLARRHHVKLTLETDSHGRGSLRSGTYADSSVRRTRLFNYQGGASRPAAELDQVCSVSLKSVEMRKR